MSVQRILHYFHALSAIPRRSGDEEAVADYLLRTGKELGLQALQDAGGNVILRKPGPGQVPPTILQSHMDMVWESQGPAYEAGVCVLERDGALYADRSTLGADDGIGVALTLALLEREDVTNLEALFTVDEETSMSGASNLDSSLLSGRWLINLDSETEGVFTTSSAGGQTIKLSFPLSRESLSGAPLPVWLLQVSGAKGGHSGLEINRPHKNAIQILSQWLDLLPPGCSLCSLRGGTRTNAIPTQAEAVLCAQSRKALLDAADRLSRQWSSVEPQLHLSVQEVQPPLPQSVVSSQCQAALSALLAELPHGVLDASQEMTRLSCNLAKIWLESDKLCVELSVRAASAALLATETDAISQLARRHGGEISLYGDYPSWEQSKRRFLEREFCRLYRSLFHTDAVCEHVHAGVECGILQQKAPFIQDMISIGPTITGAHTVQESVDLASIEKLERLLLAFLSAQTPGEAAPTA